MEYLHLSAVDIAMVVSSAIDFSEPSLPGHHFQVADTCRIISGSLGMNSDEQEALILAALMHDIGILTLSERKAMKRIVPPGASDHAIRGEWLLSRGDIFRETAEIVRFHHVKWENGRGRECDGRPVALNSHVIHLAESLVSMIDPEQDIMMQYPAIVQSIRKGNTDLFHPDCLSAFMDTAEKEAFWLEISSEFSAESIREFFRDRRRWISREYIQSAGETVSRIVDFRSRHTCAHSRCVAMLASAIAELAGLDASTREMIQLAGYFHDLGMLAVPGEVINDRNRLTDSDFRKIRRHPFYTYKLLNRIEGFGEFAAIAAWHHERLNGSGYPFHLGKDDLTDVSCLLAVADVFTALAEDRPYRKGLNREESMRILEHLTEVHILDGKYMPILENHFGDLFSLWAEEQGKVLAEYESFSVVCATPEA